MITALRRFSSLATQSTRFFTTSEKKFISNKEKLKKLQAEYQIDNGKEIYRRQPNDNIFLFFVYGLTIVGTRQKIIRHIITRNTRYEVKFLRLSSSKKNGTLSLCAKPSPKAEDPPICAPPPPPCGPPCPPPMRSLIPDPNNPCNYCPPDPLDSDEPDLTKLKKQQCHFQVDDDVPVYLKRGTIDVYFMQLVYILSILGFGLSLQTFYRLICN